MVMRTFLSGLLKYNTYASFFKRLAKIGHLCELFGLLPGDVEASHSLKVLKNERFQRGVAMRLRDLEIKNSHNRIILAEGEKKLA